MSKLKKTRTDESRRKLLRMNWDAVIALATRYKEQHGRYPFAILLDSQQVIAVEAEAAVKIAGHVCPGTTLQRELSVIELNHDEDYFILVNKGGVMRTTYQTGSLRMEAEKNPNVEIRTFNLGDHL